MKSINTKILVLLLCSVFATAILTGGAGILNAERVVKEDSAQVMNLLCEETAQEINTGLLGIEQSVNAVCHYADSQFTEDQTLWTDPEYLDAYTEQIKEVLFSVADSTDCAIAAYIRFNPELFPPKAGAYLLRKSTDEAFMEYETTDFSLYTPEDVSHVGWYYIPVANGGPTWMEPYDNENFGIEMVSYVVPMYREDILIGVIGLDIDVRYFKEKVEEVSVYDTGYAFVASKNGDIVYHKDYPDGIAVEDFDENLIALGEVIGQDREAGQVYDYQWDGEEKRLVFQPLVNRMYLIITAPASEIDASRNQLIFQCLTILVLVLIIAAILSVCLVRQITKPLQELTRASEQIAKGNWDVDIQCKTKDEVGVLAATLKNTIAELNKNILYVRKMAYTDNLTGLYNRHYLVEFCRESVAEDGMRAGVVFCDLNGLKYRNDHFGHSAGDELILRFANALKESFSENMCCRMSGDEFVAIALHITEEEFMVHVEQLIEKNLDENGISMAAIGYCWKPDAVRVGDMLTEAENAMYQDKKIFYEKYPMYKR